MDKEMQLFLLPYAGGSSFSFMRVKRFCDPRIEVITIEYSGHGSRHQEPIIKEYKQFLMDVVGQIEKKRKKDVAFAILGYSMGSVIAFDICSLGLLGNDPLHLFFCAEGSLVAENSARNYSQLPIEQFEEKILDMGGLDERLLNDKSALKAYFDLIWDDFNILAQYKYNGRKVVNNATVIYSPYDQTCCDMHDWEKVVEGHVDYYEVGNNHFFINQEYEEMAKIINHELLDR